MRIGLGYDLHKLSEGRKLILGGVEIAFKRGCVAHSDGDVLIHAIIDAILGALGKRDIGVHFPDTDPKYKNIDSLKLLRVIKEKYPFEIINIDSNIILEKPKLMPYIDKMRENISKELEIEKEMISIKAKTNEGLGEVGRGDAVISNASVLLKLL